MKGLGAGWADRLMAETGLSRLGTGERRMHVLVRRTLRQPLRHCTAALELKTRSIT